jgi:hypothetical protein
MPSSLVFSAPVSDVAFDGTDELAAVLPSFETLLADKAVRRIILTATAPLGSVSLPTIARTSSLNGKGLSKVSAASCIRAICYIQSKFSSLVQTDRVGISGVIVSQVVVIRQFVGQQSFIRVLRRQIKHAISA